MQLALICHDIRSVHNVGSIFRTADAASVEKIYLCGITPTPLDRFRKPRRDFVKVSLGAENSVPWEFANNTIAVLEALKKEGWIVFALEQSKDSIRYDRIPRELLLGQKCCLILGAEVEGIPIEILNLADAALEIPMRGATFAESHHPKRSGQGKESLNVSVAFGIAIFALRSMFSL